MQRLKKRSQFQAVLANEKVAKTAHFALHRCTLSTPGLGPTPSGRESRAPLFPLSDVWLGVLVPKRWAKRAVTRNAIRRQILNVSSELEMALPVAAYVVRLRSALNRATYPSASSGALKSMVRTELVHLFSDAARKPAASRSSAGAAQ